MYGTKTGLKFYIWYFCANEKNANQTPTPTRFIRNCEEVGLFQDLQNVNPFEETFKKAIEHSKTGLVHVPDSPNDDSLHTPQILHHTTDNLNKQSYTSEKHFDDTTTIDDDILRIDSQDSSSRDDCDNCIVVQENHFSYSTELSTSNEREYEVSSSNSNDTIVEDVAIVRKNLNNYLLKSSSISKRDAKTNVKEKIKQVLHNKRKSDIKPLDLKVKDNDNPKKPRQRVNFKSKLKNAIDLESKAIKIEFHRNIDLYDKNLNEVEKRRAMNRMAQMRSRKRKKMWLDQMEQEIEKLKTDNKLILTENQKLKDENIALKSMLLKHSSCSFSTKCK
ncbi:cyclic-amp response element binding protein [Holotrichia oblita]|uniref:Cyclic-amp response element binding protein n=1 Tax=Holotrichia oblita TaxID=644536 RepID=A0ACB9TN52_HOLOL|nr:cyclic-amp response element binding protein [Holotrichia oblita]